LNRGWRLKDTDTRLRIYPCSHTQFFAHESSYLCLSSTSRVAQVVYMMLWNLDMLLKENEKLVEVGMAAWIICVYTAWWQPFCPRVSTLKSINQDWNFTVVDLACIINDVLSCNWTWLITSLVRLHQKWGIMIKFIYDPLSKNWPFLHIPQIPFCDPMTENSTS